MKVPAKINVYRRKLTTFLTSWVGNSPDSNVVKPQKREEIKKILLCRPNHRLGNQLLISPVIQELTSIFPDATIDLFVRGTISKVLLKNYDCIDRIICLPGKPFKNLFNYFSVWLQLRKCKYDLVLNTTPDSSSGKLSTQFSISKYKCFGNEEDNLRQVYPDYVHMAKEPVYNIRQFLSNIEKPDKNKPVKPLNLKLSDQEKSLGKEILNTLVDPGKPTICIYTFATGDKCYSPTWWSSLYEALVKKYKDYNIFEMLPKENVSQIDFKASSYLSGDLREIGAIISNTAVFIGADSGMMHLASATGTPVVGLFSVTSIEKYQPYNAGSVAIDTNKTDVKGIIEVLDKIL